MPSNEEQLAALVDRNPHLDAGELEAYFWALRENDPEQEKPRPYRAEEKAAHDLLMAYLTHVGARAWGEQDLPEQSEVTRERFIQAARLATAIGSEGPEPVAMLPLGVLEELLTEYATLLAAVSKNRPLERLQSVVRDRLALDAALRAWEGR
ncbi:hypothetical protein [Amycolatopsis anabasis]|uniref:hypothetical protein n=1 Tax=Amycolatopsis anabasis TaxID=1840409 RepID=UPI00131A98DC|nr:hypothetical protein [Amycolatopsis anabasis]